MTTPDNLLRRIYAARAKQQGINKTWDKLPDHVQAYWRDLVDVVRPVIEEEMRAPVENEDIVDERAL